MTSATEPQSPPPVALVTGAANRIGAAIVRLLHHTGYRVVLHYRNSQQAALTLADELSSQRQNSVLCLQADLSELGQLASLAERSVAKWGRLDALVNNASSFYPVSLQELDEHNWLELVNSNARAPLFLCKHLQAALTASRGCIVNLVDSTALAGVAGFTPYTMAKAALANMTRSLAKELAPEVRVNGVSPGAILWPEYTGGVSEEEKRQTLARVALGRMGTPEDIANAVLFLIRDASYVTGQVIAVDGGV
jgi:pteridine reductase